MQVRPILFPMAAAIFALLAAGPARALDKQGSAHGGSIEGPTSGFDISGSLLLGSSIYNPTYAARPDNTGLALMRYAGHLDIDLIGRRLFVPIDVNLLSDQERAGFDKLAPTELDIITGLGSTWAAGPGAFELGARLEHDRPVDRSGGKQSYVDVRARYLYSLAEVFPGLRSALRGGDVSGWATLGWFAYNPNYFARPDNTGRALFRYALHGQLSLWNDVVAIGLDGTFFSDRQADNIFRPSELDLTPSLIVRHGAFEFQVAYEADMPLDRDGLTQRFLYALVVWNFSLVKHKPHPAQQGEMHSP